MLTKPENKLQEKCAINFFTTLADQHPQLLLLPGPFPLQQQGGCKERQKQTGRQKNKYKLFMKL